MKWCAIALLVAAGAARAGVVAASRDAAEAGNRFAVKLYDGVRRAGGNVVVGPLCVSNALTLVAAGARGETRREMVRGLGWEGDGAGVDEEWGKLMRAVTKAGGSVDVRSASGVWVRKGHAVPKAFVREAKEVFGAEVGSWEDPESGAKKISGWVERSTGGRIRDFVDASMLGGADVFVGATTYFKGKWSEPFEKGKTADEAFRVREGKSVTVKMMHQVAHGAGYGETDAYQALWLGYSGDGARMVVVLPKGEIEEVEREIVSGGVTALAKPTGERASVAVSLPRFRMVEKYELGGALRTMGMPLKGGANFSGMGDGAVTSVAHEAMVDVNEEGTEAAAATGIGVGAVIAPARKVEFRADHPFLFMIVHERTGAVLFMGRVADPTAG